MSLYQQLTTLRIKYAKLLPPHRTAVMDGHMEFLRANGAMDRILKEGDTAPEFTLKDGLGKVVSSKTLLENGPLVINFFRGLWCPYCVGEVNALNEAYDVIRAEGAEVVAISPQAPNGSEQQMKEGNLRFSILVDPENEVASKFHLVYTFSEDLRGLYEGVFKLDIARKNASSQWQLPIPARVVIGRDGIIRDVKADPDYRFRPEPSDTIEVLKRLKK